MSQIVSINATPARKHNQRIYNFLGMNITAREIDDVIKCLAKKKKMTYIVLEL